MSQSYTGAEDVNALQRSKLVEIFSLYFVGCIRVVRRNFEKPSHPGMDLRSIGA